MSEFWQRTLALVQALDSTNYYQLLGVAQNASGDAIRDSYYVRVRELHPDRHVRERDPQRKQAVTRLFARVGEAYRVLSAPALRETYDEVLGRGQVRLSRDEPAPKKRRPGADPANPQARKMFDRAKQMMERGDRKGARAQLDLALQFDPESEVIRDLIAELDEIEQSRQRRMQPKKAAPAAPPEPPAPTAAAEERTPAPEVPSFTIRCADEAKAISFFHGSVERQRLVLRTSDPIEAGARVAITVVLPGEVEVELTGTVAKAKDGAIGVRLDPISAEARAPFAAIIESPAQPADEAPTPPAASPAAPAGETAGDRYQESLRMLAAALLNTPNDRELRAAYYVTLGYVDKAAGREREARIHFETAIALDPRCSQAKQGLRDLRRSQ